MRKGALTANDFLDGPSLFKIICGCVEMDTKATMREIKQQIRDLHVNYVARFCNDPDALIEEFLSNFTRLSSFGATMGDSKSYLLRALEQIRGSDFQRKIKRMADAYDDDAPDCVTNHDQVIERSRCCKSQITAAGKYGYHIRTASSRVVPRRRK